MGKEDIDFGLENIWNVWKDFRKGKRVSEEMHVFIYNLESRLFKLHQDLINGKYRHGQYRKFIVCDNKRREISVSSARDRVVHRLIYNFLISIWDKTFIYDVWSCRKAKGLQAAINRTQRLLKANSKAYVWRADIHKFFDNVDQKVLMNILKRRVKDPKAIFLIYEVLKSYKTSSEGKGIPIGNLTSQIFSNIYLNELDRYVKHTIRAKAYLRYGDDFILFEKDSEKIQNIKIAITKFLSYELKLKIHMKNNFIGKTKQGIKFLGVELWPSGRRLPNKIQIRIADRLTINNIPSYSGLISQHGCRKLQKWFNWKIIEIINSSLCK